MRKTTCSMAPRSEPAGLVRAANCAMAAPARSPRLAAARIAPPPVASAAASIVRRSKRARSESASPSYAPSVLVAPSYAPMSRPVHLAPGATCMAGIARSPVALSTLRATASTSAASLLRTLPTRGPDGMVHHGAGGRGPQQCAHLLDVLVGGIEPEVEGGGIENDGHPIMDAGHVRTGRGRDHGAAPDQRRVRPGVLVAPALGQAGEGQRLPVGRG